MFHLCISMSNAFHIVNIQGMLSCKVGLCKSKEDWAHRIEITGSVLLIINLVCLYKSLQLNETLVKYQ
jgi:hypothetical protein